jgi:hypothetical protein
MYVPYFSLMQIFVCLAKKPIKYIFILYARAIRPQLTYLLSGVEQDNLSPDLRLLASFMIEKLVLVHIDIWVGHSKTAKQFTVCCQGRPFLALVLIQAPGRV